MQLKAAASQPFIELLQVDRDGGDNVLASDWYAERSSLPANDPNRRAATLSATYADTPTGTHLDALGRPVRVVTVNTGGVEALTRTELDVTGNPLRIVDARDNVAQENVYGLGGQLLQEDSVDAGWRRAITDVVGNPLRTFNARGFVQRWRYDEALRPTHHYVAFPTANGPGPERLVTRTVYGESLASPETLNLRGRAHRVYDGAGMSTAEAYDFAGNLLSSARQLAVEYRDTVDWIALDNLEDVTDLEQAAAAQLETEVFRTTSTFDALGRPTSQTTPEQSTVRFAYNDASLLERVTANVRGSANETTFVEAIDYDEKGRRERIAYGNGTTTTYAYDRRSFRLTRLRTTDANRTFQDLSYTYDVVGNIVEQRDGAQQDVYFNGQLVTPVARYEYDALYRLTEASGREHGGQNSSQPTAFGSSSLHPQDATAMRSYVERYVYDVVGNILSMQHEAVGAPAQSWTQTYQYAANGNRLLANSIPGLPGDFSHTYSYDPHGNMLAMPHLASIDFDHADRMQSAELGGGSTVYFVYDASGTRVRKVRESQGSAANERVYLGSVELYRERNSGGVLQLERETLHVSDDGGRICDLETRTVQGAVPEATPTTHHRYQYSNHLGSASLELTANAEVISYEEYHPYGTSSYRAVNSAIDVSARRYRYTGMERDEETGLALHGARYYACWLGRWNAADPIGLGDGPNRYSYVLANPVAFLDPSGGYSEPHLESMNIADTEMPRRGVTPYIEVTVDAHKGDTAQDIATRALSERFGEHGLSPQEATSLGFGRAAVLGDGSDVVSQDGPQSFRFTKEFIVDEVFPLLDKKPSLYEPGEEAPEKDAEHYARELVGGSGTSDSKVILAAATGLSIIDIVTDLVAIKALAKQGIKAGFKAIAEGLKSFAAKRAAAKAEKKAAKDISKEAAKDVSKEASERGAREVAETGVPELTGTTNKELFAEVQEILRNSNGTQQEKADLFEALIPQIDAKGGGFVATRSIGTEGSEIFLGTTGAALVVTPAGDVFRGSLVGGGVRFIRNLGKMKPDFKRLEKLQ